MTTTHVSIKLDQGYIVFSFDTREFYDITIEDMKLDLMQEKSWFTSDVENRMNLLLDSDRV